MNIPRKILGGAAAVLAVATLGGALQAALAAAPPPPPPEGPGMHHPRGPGAGGPMGDAPGWFAMPALRELDLTQAQRDQIRALLRNDREQQRSQQQGPGGAGPGQFAALANPGDPGHLAAVEAAKQAAVARVQHFADLEQQVYALLTPAQQAKLPQVLADLQQNRRGRRPPGAGGPPQP